MPQADTCASCVGRSAQEEQLFPGPIPPSQSAPRRQEGSDRGCRVDPDNRLSLLRDGTCYQDLGPEYFTRRNPAQAAARLANRIRNLGYHVEIRAAA